MHPTNLTYSTLGDGLEGIGGGGLATGSSSVSGFLVVSKGEQALRFLQSHAAVSNLFNLGRYLIPARNYRKLREHAFNDWSVVVA
jgi:hypothetical protein